MRRVLSSRVSATAAAQVPLLQAFGNVRRFVATKSSADGKDLDRASFAASLDDDGATFSNVETLDENTVLDPAELKLRYEKALSDFSGRCDAMYAALDIMTNEANNVKETMNEEHRQLTRFHVDTVQSKTGDENQERIQKFRDNEVAPMHYRFLELQRWRTFYSGEDEPLMVTIPCKLSSIFSRLAGTTGAPILVCCLLLAGTYFCVWWSALMFHRMNVRKRAKRQAELEKQLQRQPDVVAAQKQESGGKSSAKPSIILIPDADEPTPPKRSTVPLDLLGSSKKSR
jgi:hypothetical protein